MLIAAPGRKSAAARGAKSRDPRVPMRVTASPIVDRVMRPCPLLLTIVVVAGLVACAPRRPPFVEPDWGEAPSPYPVEITEVTREYRHCAERCTYDRLVLRRDGTVSRRFSTTTHLDSLLTAQVDSLTFIELVVSLDKAGLFRPMVGAGEQVPLAVDSYLISAASLCRRAVATYSPLSGDWYPGSQAVLAVERATSNLRWNRPNRRVLPEVQVSLIR